jgi:hypothetical protein
MVSEFQKKGESSSKKANPWISRAKWLAGLVFLIFL